MRVTAVFKAKNMIAKKLDFSLERYGNLEPIKARIFQNWDGEPVASIDGSIFYGAEYSSAQIDQLISILQNVRKAMGGLDESTT